MPRVSDEHLDRRRREILEAAWRCFGRQGFHQTTMRDICREADLSPGAVYQYFEGKEGIIEAVAEAGRRAGVARVTPADETDGPVEALVESLGNFLVCLDDPDALESLRIDVQLCAEALREDRVRAVVRENLDSHAGQFARLIRRGQEEGSLDASLDPDAAARVVVAIFHGLEIQKTIDPDIDMQAAARAAAALLRGTFIRSSE